MRYLNAGHNPPFLLRNSGQVQELPASSYPLGMLPSVSYEEGRVDMAPGEMMLIYSDGLTEATNSEGVEFSPERIRSLMPDLNIAGVKEGGRILLDEVRSFMGPERPHDDLSIILLQREE